MFAIVRTGGKQYRVAAGDKIAVEKLAGEAGDSVTLDDILMAGEGADMKDVAKLTVGARIIAQDRTDKVIVFKKRRRHNYRRKQGHRQSVTLLEILSIGDHKAAPKKAAEPKTVDDDAKESAAAKPAAKKEAPKKAAADKSDDKATPAKAAAKKASPKKVTAEGKGKAETVTKQAPSKNAAKNEEKEG